VIWLNPTALFALAAIAAPILIHVLVQRRAEPFPFPTLRFLRPTRLAAIRRHLLDDVPLLAVRVAVLASAVAALAGPLIVTASRRDAWSRRIVRAVVIDAAVRGAAPRSSSGDGAHLSREFSGTSLSDGVRRAVAWLEHAPPANRELLIASPLPIGAISAADLAAVPPDVGIAFDRSGTLPAERTVPFGRLVTAAGVVSRVMVLAGDRTSVRDTPASIALPDALPIDIVARAETKPIVAAALDAVLSQRVWLPPPDRRVRALFDGTDGDVEPPRRRWMADAIARLTRDADLQDAASRSSALVGHAAWMRAPWQVVALAADGQPLVAAAAASGALVVSSAAPAADVVTPILLRAVSAAIAQPPEVGDDEVVPIADAQLRAWSRPATAPPTPRIDAIDGDDRRWFWIAVLCLLGLEAWMRRTARRAAGREAAGEAARVA